MTTPSQDNDGSQCIGGDAPPATRISAAAAATVLPPRKTPRQPRAIATAAAILEATARILEEGGALDTNRIAERAGVGIATLYQYFDGKSAILAALSRQTRQALVQSVTEAVAAARSHSLVEGVHAILAAALAPDANRPALAIALDQVEDALPLAADDLAARDALRNALAEFLVMHTPDRSAAQRHNLADDLCAITGSLVLAATMRGEAVDAALTGRIARYVVAMITGAQSGCTADPSTPDRY